MKKGFVPPKPVATLSTGVLYLHPARQKKRVAWLLSHEHATCAAEPSRGGGKSARQRGRWLWTWDVRSCGGRLLVHTKRWWCTNITFTCTLSERTTPGVLLVALCCAVVQELSQM